MVIGLGSVVICLLADTSSEYARRLYVACLIAPAAANIRGFLRQRIKYGGDFPLVTFGGNFSGSVAMAICYVVQSNFDCTVKEVVCWVHIIIPFLNAWTTVSSVSVDLVELRESGNLKMLWGYVILLVASCQIISGAIIGASNNLSVT